jgi:hypothetical protein
VECKIIARNLIIKHEKCTTYLNYMAKKLNNVIRNVIIFATIGPVVWG